VCRIATQGAQRRRNFCFFLVFATVGQAEKIDFGKMGQMLVLGCIICIFLVMFKDGKKTHQAEASPTRPATFA
jgi:hypothetical protein